MWQEKQKGPGSKSTECGDGDASRPVQPICKLTKTDVPLTGHFTIPMKMAIAETNRYRLGRKI